MRQVVDLFASGGQLGELQDEHGRLLRVRIAPELPDLRPRGPADQLRELTVRAGSGGQGQPVPLGVLGRPAYVVRPAALRTEHGELCSYVYVDLKDGADVQRFVERARSDVDAAVAAGQVRLGPGERIEWTGSTTC